MKSSRELVLETACGAALTHLVEYIRAGQITGRFPAPFEIESQLRAALALADLSPPRGWQLNYLGLTEAGEHRWSVGENAPRAYLTTDPQTAELIRSIPEMVSALQRIQQDASACTCDEVSWHGEGHATCCPHAIVESVFDKAGVKASVEEAKTVREVPITAGAPAVIPVERKLPCGCANHDGGPYAAGCAALADAEPNVFAEIVDCALNWIQDDNDKERRIPDGWQAAIRPFSPSATRPKCSTRRMRTCASPARHPKPDRSANSSRSSGATIRKRRPSW